MIVEDSVAGEGCGSSRLLHLGYATAAVLLERCTLEHRSLLRPISESDLEDAVHSATEIADSGLETWGLTTRGLDVMVPRCTGHRKSDEVSFHLVSCKLPSGSFLRVGDSSIAVACPELCLVQMATSLDELAWLKLAYRFCGTYSYWEEGQSHADADELRRRRMLTSRERLADYIERLKALNDRCPPGAGLSLRRLSWLVNRSASPGETATVLALTLPYRMGGYSLEQPVLNRRLNLSPEASEVAGTQFCRLDLGWQHRRYDLEYNGRRHQLREGRDVNRKMAIRMMGVEMDVVTYDQLTDATAFEQVAFGVAKKTDKRIARHRLMPIRKRQLLLDELTGTTRIETGAGALVI